MELVPGLVQKLVVLVQVAVLQAERLAQARSLGAPRPVEVVSMLADWPDQQLAALWAQDPAAAGLAAAEC